MFSRGGRDFIGAPRPGPTPDVPRRLFTRGRGVGEGLQKAFSRQKFRSIRSCAGQSPRKAADLSGDGRCAQFQPPSDTA